MRHYVHSYARAAEAAPAPGIVEAPLYPDDLLPELQSTLAALADLDVQFEIARDGLEDWSEPEEVKQRCRAELEQAHRQARETHLQRLTRLQERIRTVRCVP